ncbi:MAG: orotate phosphoribosyltransferase [Sedimentisphaerales bacterium]|nr:orotate phosphoribosyltransferase [Sedimentisphaerales bacterium]
MQSYQLEFIEFLVTSDVLTFGDFVTKSGRKTPYFINTGKYRTGEQLGQLGRFYASALIDYFGRDFDNLYGPAYKGISLAVCASIALHEQHGHNVSVTYNRKEAKDHGEGGSLIGHKYSGGENVVIIEDVITAGTSVRESVDLLRANNDPNVVGVIVSVDRMERGQGELSAIQEIGQEFDVPVHAIITIKDIIEALHNQPLDGMVHIDDTMKTKIEEYLTQYGTKHA